MSALPKVTIPQTELSSFCQRWHIQELAIFGSALNDRFSAESDIDLLVTFANDMAYTFGQLARMQDELQAIFGRPVDLIEKKAVEESPNYIRRHEILESAQVIYQATYA